MDLDLNEFDTLSDSEQRVIDEINSTEVAYPQNTTIPELFDIQATTTPTRIAVMDNGRNISYAEINTNSNKMARILSSAGVRPNQLVAVVLDRGVELLSAVFGILKAGGAYVPIDPEYPQKRIEYMLQDSACNVIVTDSNKLRSILSDLPESVKVVVCLDDTDFHSEKLTVIQRKDIERADNSSWVCPAVEENVAYVVYTSGSTGDPKGVMITHKAILNTLFWLQETFSLTMDDVVAQKTSVSFTDSVVEFFWPMIVGAKLSIFDVETVRDPQSFYNKLHEDKVSITQFVPAQLNLFLEEIRKENIEDPLPYLKWVFNGGEAILVNTVKDWYSVFKKAKIANIYGMTESAIYATNYIIEEMPSDSQLSIPIGKPIANTHVYILNKDGQLCPFEAKGEICIGGIGMTIGYFNKEDLTEKAFTKHPETGERLYCTGDLGLLRPDGIIEYLGRKDDQVQVRGYRVELKEVERAVSNFHLIKETAVIAQVDSHGVTNLLCYFTSSEIGLEIKDLQDYLKEILPNYMIPSLFMELSEMPLTSNGKIDRKNLPQPQGRSKRSTEYVSPRNDKEKELVRIWADILGIVEDEIGIHDSFFESGGTSISIIRLQRRMKRELGSKVTVAELFSYPTISTYMEFLDGQNKGNEELDQNLMNLLNQIEDGSLDLDESIQLLNDLKEE
ncbi:non-ribosomal peptide synthetase [Bacillus cereus]|uniref:amino acid adenylation domain-containing protein n=1 Tax=Bacillus cereus TaxID=1396 RepID=UPI0012475844|nr:non-ribosomal peptide synthetase [Bacillus cereus]MCU5475458.1 non-ribosomal peptide synthetase [Bacillus cereus]MCU5614893.1 non-ribosomal peptide synthetase [Bacillus cereus]